MVPSAKFAVLGTLALALAACSSAPTPQATEQPTVTVIEGRVVGASGTGTVGAPSLGSVTASTAADGRFALSLPQTPGAALSSAAQVMSGLQCSGSLSSSDASAQGYLLSTLSVKDGGAERQVTAVQGSKSGVASRSVNARAWLYTDKATRLSGSVDCARLLNVSQISSLPVTIDVIAKPGWNVVELNIRASANLFLQVSASGTVVNSAAGSALSEWRTAEELQAQISF